MLILQTKLYTKHIQGLKINSLWRSSVNRLRVTSCNFMWFLSEIVKNDINFYGVKNIY